MPTAESARPIVPIPAADALFTDTLRAALAVYIRGDYARAAELFQDAAAVAVSRPDARLCKFVGMCLQSYVVDGELASRPLDDADDVRRSL